MHPDYPGIFILIACAACWVQGFLIGWSLRISTDGVQEEWRKPGELLRERRK